MGLITKLFDAMFNGKNIVKQTVEIFRPNAENQAARGHAYNTAALTQFAAEFGGCGWFNRVLDGLNSCRDPHLRLAPLRYLLRRCLIRCGLATDAGLVLVPDQLCGCWGDVVLFGARELHKFRSAGMAKEAVRILGHMPIVAERMRQLHSSVTPQVAADATPEAGLSII